MSEGDRTLDNWSHNPVLYQLSYTHRKNNSTMLAKEVYLVNENCILPRFLKVARQEGLEPSTL